MTEKKYSDITLLSRLLVQARPYWAHLAGLFFLGLLATPLALLMPVPLKIAVDSVIGSDPLPETLRFFIPGFISNTKSALLIFAVTMQIVIVLLIHLQSLGNYVMETYTGEHMTLSFRQNLFRHAQKLSFSYHDNRGTADSIYRIQNDAQSIQWVTIYGVMPFISSVVTFVSMIYVTARINVHLAAIALSVSPFLFALSRIYNKKMRPKYSRVKKMESHVLNIVQEVLSAFRVVKAFGREETEQDRFTVHYGETIRGRIWLAFGEGLFGIFVNVSIAFGTAAVLYIGARNVIMGTLTLGELLMVIAYISQLYGPLKTIGTLMSNLQGSLASSQRAFELIDEIPEVTEKPDALSIDRASGAIEFDNVSFSYDGKNTVLKNISFNVAPGARVGISGKTGAGKTTLVSLLMRFYDPDSGSILLDGIDLREYILADIREQISLVLQEPILFSTSITENIAYGRLNANKQEIVEAAKAANAHDFIAALPDGYDTVVGERGMRLSGGERQRIALARAFIKDAPILLLDEPTSSVDLKTEADIMEAMERLMRGRTTFMIAHRTFTLQNCDTLLLLKDGHLVSQSSHMDSTFEKDRVAKKQKTKEGIQVKRRRV